MTVLSFPQFGFRVEPSLLAGFHPPLSQGGTPATWTVHLASRSGSLACNIYESRFLLVPGPTLPVDG